VKDKEKEGRNKMWMGTGEAGRGSPFDGLLVLIDNDLVPLRKLPDDRLYDFEIVTDKSRMYGAGYTVEKLERKLAAASVERDIKYVVGRYRESSSIQQSSGGTD
jgi:hypothetical protein